MHLSFIGRYLSCICQNLLLPWLISSHVYKYLSDDETLLCATDVTDIKSNTKENAIQHCHKADETEHMTWRPINKATDH